MKCPKCGKDMKAGYLRYLIQKAHDFNRGMNESTYCF